ncbi:hypothetical protein EAI_15641 [Harpegnathos saltator]|uniref:Uncharacterized protein n=1 Tax=Harpegnathos saltator TaxID=610380 RepID=E2B6L6_HARSA|nr:hypothetical protein EAI_15641 [Harpegnathos saltator]
MDLTQTRKRPKGSNGAALEEGDQKEKEEDRDPDTRPKGKVRRVDSQGKPPTNAVEESVGETPLTPQGNELPPYSRGVKCVEVGSCQEFAQVEVPTKEEATNIKAEAPSGETEAALPSVSREGVEVREIHHGYPQPLEGSGVMSDSYRLKPLRDAYLSERGGSGLYTVELPDPPVNGGGSEAAEEGLDPCYSGVLPLIRPEALRARYLDLPPGSADHPVINDGLGVADAPVQRPPSWTSPSSLTPPPLAREGGILGSRPVPKRGTTPPIPNLSEAGVDPGSTP